MHQPGHGLGLGHIQADLLEYPFLGIGEAKGQQLQKALEEPPLASQGQHRCRPLPQLLPPLAQGQLQQQKFIKHQPAAAGLQGLPGAGPMDLDEGLSQGHKLPLFAPAQFQRVLEPCQRWQYRLDGLAQLFGD